MTDTPPPVLTDAMLEAIRTRAGGLRWPNGVPGFYVTLSLAERDALIARLEAAEAERDRLRKDQP